MNLHVMCQYYRGVGTGCGGGGCPPNVEVGESKLYFRPPPPIFSHSKSSVIDKVNLNVDLNCNLLYLGSSHAVEELAKLRSEDKFNELWDAAESWRCSMNADQPKLPRHVGATARFQSSQPHKFATPKDMYRAKYFEIIDTAVGRLNFRITNKAVPVLITTENLPQAGWQSTTIHDDDLNTVWHGGAQYPDLDRVRLAAQPARARQSASQLPSEDIRHESVLTRRNYFADRQQHCEEHDSRSCQSDQVLLGSSCNLCIC